jgi:hypothetical protein
MGKQEGESRWWAHSKSSTVSIISHCLSHVLHLFFPPFSIGFGSISWGSLHTLCMSSYIIHLSPLATLRYYANLSFEVSGACLWDGGVHCPVKKSISDVLLPLCTRVLDHRPCNHIQSVCTRAWLFVGAF